MRRAENAMQCGGLVSIGAGAIATERLTSETTWDEAAAG